MTNVTEMSIPAERMIERRKHGRTPLKMRLSAIRLDPDGGEVLDSLDMVDISRSGIGAYCDRSFYPRQRVILNLPLSHDRGRRSIYARIVRCRGGEEGYRVGLEFDSSSLHNYLMTTSVPVAAA